MTGRKILVIGEGAESSGETIRMLSRWGYDVSVGTDDGSDGLERAARLKPDVALFERGGSVQGIEASRRMRDLRLSPVIWLVENMNGEVAAGAREAGVMACLARPVKESGLRATIEVAAHLWRQMDRLRAESESLGEKLRARDLLDRAKSILMNQYGLREQEAFRKLQTQAMAMRRSMKHIAEAVIIAHETGRRQEQ